MAKKKLPLTAKQREAWLAATPRERPSDLLQRYEATVVDLARQREALLAALGRAQRLFDEALPKFNWGHSALDGNAIALLNQVPGEVAAAITLGSLGPAPRP